MSIPCRYVSSRLHEPSLLSSICVACTSHTTHHTPQTNLNVLRLNHTFGSGVKLIIFQFAPTEDLSKYPRTLERDLELLSTLLPSPTSPSHPRPSDRHTQANENATTEKAPDNGTSSGPEPEPEPQSPLVIFNPSEEVMYPLRGDLQDLTQKRGVEVDVKGWGDVMEGASRRMSISLSPDTNMSLKFHHSCTTHEAPPICVSSNRFHAASLCHGNQEDWRKC